MTEQVSVAEILFRNISSHDIQPQTFQVAFSKQPKLGLTHELSSRISESTTGYTFTPCVGSFTSPGIDTTQKGPLAF